MKKITLLLTVLVLSTQVFAQKIIKKIAAEVCDCVDEHVDEDKPDLVDIIDWCMKQKIVKYEKSLIREYGQGQLEGEAGEFIGLEIGKEMLKSCPIIFDVAVDQTGSKKARAGELFSRGQAQADSGEYVMAIDLYSQAIAINPACFDYFNFRGIAYFNLGEYYRAISDFYRASELEPDNHLGAYNVAYTIYKLGDNASALEAADQVIRVNDYYCEGYNLKGLIFNRENRNDSAVVYYTKAYNCDTTRLTYLYNIGYSLYQLRAYDQALECFVKAEKAGYDTYDLVLYMGNCYDQLDQKEKAIACHTRLIDNYEVNYVPYYNRGSVFMNMGQYEDALQDFVAAHALENNDLDVDEQIARVYKAMGHYDKALDKCNMIIEQQTTNATYRDLRAEVYTKLGELQHAISDYEMSLNLYPDDCRIHERLSELYKKMGDKDTAGMHLRMAQQMGCDKK